MDRVTSVYDSRMLLMTQMQFSCGGHDCPRYPGYSSGIHREVGQGLCTAINLSYHFVYMGPNPTRKWYFPITDHLGFALLICGLVNSDFLGRSHHWVIPANVSL